MGGNPADGNPSVHALIDVQRQFRRAIRDAVHRPSRKPFCWGGLIGYRQLEAIALALRPLCDADKESTYLRRLLRQVDRVLERNRALVVDVQSAHIWLRDIAACLHYPPDPAAPAHLSSGQVAQEMKALMAQFRPALRRHSAQASLYRAWHRHWEDYGVHLLHCYDIPGLPPENLAIEAFFGRIRRHQRRVSGRASTKELRNRGHYQVLFTAQSEEDLLSSMRGVPMALYQAHRREIETTETPDQFLRKLHHDPATTMQHLSDRYLAGYAQLQLRARLAETPISAALHTD